jgi:peroxiredoxin
VPTLVAAVVLVGVLCLFNLLLIFGVIRRLREQSGQLTSLLGDRPAAELSVPIGQQVDDFTATTTAGAPLSRAWLRTTTLVGFFSADCAPCKQQIPAFIQRAADFAGPALAVTVGPPDRTAELVSALDDAATVVDDGPGGSLAAAFGVRAYPTILLVDGSGRVQHSTASVAALPVFA